MSALRPKLPVDPLTYDPSSLFRTGCISQQSLEQMSGQLDRARHNVLAGIDGFQASDLPPQEPIPPACIDLPDRLLADYATRRHASELWKILGVARRLRETVDHIVVLGSGGSSLGAKALCEACAHPRHNDLSRGERGGRPRISFERDRIDNDSAQGLLDVIAPATAGRTTDDLLERFAILVISPGAGTLPTAVTTRLFLKALIDRIGGDRKRLAERVVAITSPASGLADLVRAIGCPDIFDLSDGGSHQIDSPFSVLTAAGLLPASIVGIDVVRILEGAAAMNCRFREAPVALNPVLQYAGVASLAEVMLGAPLASLTLWTNRLNATRAWHDQLRCAPRTVEGESMLVTNLFVGEPRRDRLALPSLSPWVQNEDALHSLIGQTWPELLLAESQVSPVLNGPAATLCLPRLDEHALGQLLQMLMLAAVVKRQLVFHTSGPRTPEPCTEQRPSE